jgi:hypothetical protein
MQVASAWVVGFLTFGGGGNAQPFFPTLLRAGSERPFEAIAMDQELHQSQNRDAEGPPTGTQAAKDLHAYYADQEKEPAWRGAVRRLSEGDPAQQTKAAAYLRDLLAQALKDELAGLDPRQMSPFWGEGPTSKARELRQSVAAALGKAAPTPRVLPVVRWFLEEEKLTELQTEVIRIVTRLQGPEADSTLLDLAIKPHPNVEVALVALEQVGERKLKITAEQLAPLCQHHRTKLREAARALNAKLGYPAPSAFDAARAIQSESIHRLMDEIGHLLDEPVPANAPFACVTTTHTYRDGLNFKGTPTSVRGWLLKEDAEQWELLLLNRFHSRFPKKGGSDMTVALSHVTMEAEVDRVAALRRGGGDGMLMSARAGFSGEHLGPKASPYEALLAQMLYAAKRYDLAAKVLLPALDTLPMDSHLLEITRMVLGDWYGQDMLVAFVGERDYAKTERLAKGITERFPGTQFYGYAVRLLEELPKRREDFKAFRLPTPKEWEEQKKRMSRRAQIDFLCARFRLLNCYRAASREGRCLADRSTPSRAASPRMPPGGSSFKVRLKSSTR